MSRTRKIKATAAEKNGPPFIGALLRLAYRAVRQHQFRAYEQRGFGDLNQSLLNVFVHPPPDGVRPTELAERTYTTKQAMNYLLGQLESLGYVERRAEKGQRRRLVFLTRRGWQVFETQWAAAQQVEMKWAAIVGKKRFDEFMRTLRELVAIESNTATRREGRPRSRRRQQTLDTDDPADPA